jgi:hypothetical protein
MKRLLLTAVFCIGIAAVVPNFSYAQTETASPEAKPAVQEEVISPQMQGTMEDLRSVYVTTLDQYRRDEQSYRIASAQHKNVGTIATLNELVEKNKKVQISRTKTLIAYYSAEQVYLQNTVGVDLDLKTKQLTRTKEVIQQLQLQMTELQTATDRVVLDGFSSVFADTRSQYNQVMYGGLALIHIGKMQRAADKLRSVKETLYSMRTSELNALTENEQRGFDEIDRIVDELDAGSIYLYKQFNSRFTEYGVDQNTYQQYVQYLDTMYTQLRKGENFVLELSGRYR